MVTNFGRGDSLQCTAGSIKTVTKSGSDYIVKLQGSKNTGSVTLVGAAAYAYNLSGKVLTLDYVNTLENSADSVKVSGGDDRDYIVNSGEHVTLSGGGNDDTLEGGNFGEVFTFGSADGNDLITNFGLNDTLKITAGSIGSTVKSGDDLVVNVSGKKHSGAITLGGAGSYAFTKSGASLYVKGISEITNTKSKTKVVGTGGDDYIVSDGERVTIQSGAGSDTIVGSDLYGEVFAFSSADEDNLIVNFGVGDTLKCTAGSIASVHTSNDDVIVDLKGTKYAAQVTLEGAAALSMRQSGNTLIATRSSAELPSDAYWFEEAEASDPLSEITESDAAVELQFDDLKDALAATPEIAVIARKQSRSGRIS